MTNSKKNDLSEKAYVFGSIFTLANKLQSIGDKFDSNLTVKQWLLLAGIVKSGSDSPTISEVAGLIENSRQNVKKMIVILEKEGFVTIKKDSKDARALRISLTKKCRDYLQQREPKEVEFLLRLFDGFDSAGMEALVKGLSKLEKNIDRMERIIQS